MPMLAQQLLPEPFYVFISVMVRPSTLGLAALAVVLFCLRCTSRIFLAKRVLLEGTCAAAAALCIMLTRSSCLGSTT